MARIYAIIFDLDNVLFNEEDYLLVAYQNIAKFLSRCYDLKENKIYQELVNDSRKKTTMYPKLFNDLLHDLGVDQQMLPNLLEILAETKMDLKLYPMAEQILIKLKRDGIKLGLLTNGIVKVQKNKIHLLGIETYFDTIIFARELGRENEKPSPNAYLAVLKNLRVKIENTICIGDNPYTDFWGAKKLGILTVRLLSGEYKNVKLGEEYEAVKTVRTLQEFYDFFEEINLS